MLPVTTSTPTVAQALYEGIKARILKGEHRPGSVLRQDEMAMRYNASRVPLREAFSRLEAEGLLHLRPRRGYAVLSLESDEIRSIFDLRRVVEEHAGREATRSRTAGDVAAVRRLASQMSTIQPRTADDLEQWCTLNRDFHLRMIEASRQPHLIRIALQLRDLVEPYIRLETSITGEAGEADREHGAIVRAFARGDADTVGRLSAAHCQHTYQRLVQAMATTETTDESAEG